VPAAGTGLEAVGIAVCLVVAFVCGQVSGINLARLARPEREGRGTDDPKA
jgi:hypothetical protein